MKKCGWPILLILLILKRHSLLLSAASDSTDERFDSQINMGKFAAACIKLCLKRNLLILEYNEKNENSQKIFVILQKIWVYIRW